MSAPTAHAFISYSHADSHIVQRLQIHLKPIEKKYDFLIWDDRRLRAGDRWRSEIEKQLVRADVIVILLSADFLASNFVMDYEYPKALEAANERGAKVVVLIVSPCLFEEFDIAEFHFVNDPNETCQDLQSDDTGAKQERIIMRCAGMVRDYLREAVSAKKTAEQTQTAEEQPSASGRRKNSN